MARQEHQGVAASSEVLRTGRTERSLKQSLHGELQLQAAITARATEK